jgi:hypothetical protein
MRASETDFAVRCGFRVGDKVNFGCPADPTNQRPHRRNGPAGYVKNCRTFGLTLICLYVSVTE